MYVYFQFHAIAKIDLFIIFSKKKNSHGHCGFLLHRKKNNSAWSSLFLLYFDVSLQNSENVATPVSLAAWTNHFSFMTKTFHPAHWQSI